MIIKRRNISVACPQQENLVEQKEYIVFKIYIYAFDSPIIPAILSIAILKSEANDLSIFWGVPYTKRPLIFRLNVQYSPKPPEMKSWCSICSKLLSPDVSNMRSHLKIHPQDQFSNSSLLWALQKYVVVRHLPLNFFEDPIIQFFIGPGLSARSLDRSVDFYFETVKAILIGLLDTQSDVTVVPDEWTHFSFQFCGIVIVTTKEVFPISLSPPAFFDRSALSQGAHTVNTWWIPDPTRSNSTICIGSSTSYGCNS